MPTREIPRQEWPTFFDCFSNEHQDWPTTIEVVGVDVGAQFEAESEPLVGISVDLKGSARGAIEVMVGDRPEENLTHTIPAPARVWVRDGGDTAEEALEIEAGDGSKTLLRFSAGNAPQLPGNGGRAQSA